MTNSLEQICADKRKYISKKKAERSFNSLDTEARINALPPRGFVRALEKKLNNNKVGLIAEIKQASPSAGIIRMGANPVSIARAYKDGGAACLSVLTDIPYFKGHNEHLITARAAVTLPILRKDFILDVWQIAEARAIGADCVLLIMAALDDVEAKELHAAAIGYGMDVLIEVHDSCELERALALPSGLIGINNRNLKTLKTELGVTEKLAGYVPKDRIIVGESGIKTAEDIKRLRKCGVNCFLVGESLLKQIDMIKATKKLLDV
ncbi:MAG: indole-3-glycerol phosphate synthase TrpC [Alphaproteobacteria bacterium]|nr:indole-3-glycerol phosphate synthase TrpC [Alphaproteobacteria bacterium]